MCGRHIPNVVHFLVSHNKVVESGDLGGHLIGPLLPIYLFRNTGGILKILPVKLSFPMHQFDFQITRQVF